MSLEVTDLQAYPVREPVSRRAYTIIKVQTRSGPIGFGECGAVSPGEVAQARVIVRGKDATAFELVRRDLNGGMQGAVNMALLDIAGKSSKAPVYHVLGGPTRNRVRALTAVRDEAGFHAARSAGFRAVIVPITLRGRLEALRSAAPDMDFVLDGAGALKPGEASSIAAEFERFHLLWFDEPCALSNLSAVRKIASESVTPLGFGRHIDQGGSFQDLLREDIIDVLRPDIGRNGISQIRRMAAIAETYYVAVAPYHDGGPVATAAALQLAASLPNFFIQQIPFPEAEQDRHMRAELTGAIESVKAGYAELPTGPGLGVTIHEEALKRYAAA
jgi:galactonate dehydratase